MKKILDTLLLCALPASGKSEVRNLLNHISKEELEEDYHIGDVIELDDFPYVHIMRRIDEELLKINKKAIFYNDDGPFVNAYDWGTLIHLLNEDYSDLKSHNKVVCDDVSLWMFNRIDKAANKVGISNRLSLLDDKTLSIIKVNLFKECNDIYKNKNNDYDKYQKGKTIIIEMSRGGKIGSTFPLKEPYGYLYSLGQLENNMLQNASLLYIYVTPEESRRKNIERAKPNKEGSILNHSVPEKVMLNDYGCDDINYLLSICNIKNAIKIKDFFIPTGVFDNRVDKTSFLRNDSSLWSQDEVNKIKVSIKDTFDKMVNK